MSAAGPRAARVGFAQFSPRFGEPEANRERVRALLEGARADLLVLPELAFSGYDVADAAEARALAEPVPGGSSVRLLAEMSRATGGAVAAGLAERAGDVVYNAAVVVAGGDVVLRYRKVHLFGGERAAFAPGDLGYPVADLGWARVGLLVCYDWRFPEAARVVALAGADVVAHPSNLVTERAQDAMRTRALENGVFSITANRTGLEARPGRTPLRFTGRSQVVGPDGDVVVAAGDAEDALRIADIDPGRARDKSLPYGNDRFRDRRPETYGPVARPRPDDT